MKITLSQLEQYLSKAAWILKGPVDASDFKIYIFPLLFFKRISDVYDEEFQSALKESEGDEEYASLPEFHRFVIPKECHWNDVRETTTNVGLAIEKALRGIEQANQEFLYGIFGDAQWSNKNKLSDRLLIDLIEHFSQYNLSNSMVDPDMLGQAYEYLIKHFADLTNKKAGEFYTPRSVVHLLGLILDPHEGETIYDPACGTGGMLLECVGHLKENNEDYRTLKLFGQEKNLTSSSIARMNMFLHGIEDFSILRGDTLRNPAFFEADGLKTFDCVIANPPFSLQDWGEENWVNDPYGRNIAGVPPKSNGDMAWVQHMIKSMNSTGRMTVVLPHGALFRKNAEGKIVSLFPRWQMNPKMGTAISPDVKHAWGHDIYTYVSLDPRLAADAGSEKQWSQTVDATVSIGDTLFLNDFVAILMDVTRVSNVENVVLGPNDAAVRANFNVLGKNFQQFQLTPTFIIKDRMVAMPAFESEETGIKIKFTAINPQTQEFSFSYNTTQQDLIIIKAIEKPYINLVWVGSILIFIGLFVSTFRRTEKMIA